MAYSVQNFVAAVLDIAATRPTYRTGGTGKDGTCDCVGLIIGAMYALGKKKYAMHSSNYFARYQMQQQAMTKLALESDCKLGMVVYKARADRGDLNSRYKPGGRYYTGDLLDYYHVGVVTSVVPLRITHCTSGGGTSGIKTDSSLGQWQYGGMLRGIDSACPSQPDLGGDVAMEVIYRGTVTAPTGSSVNLRESPSTKGKLIERVPIGSVVDVWEDAQGWAHIQTAEGRVGYMMSLYLDKVPDEKDEDAAGGLSTTGIESVSIYLPIEIARTLYEALEQELANG